jgi:UDP-N-acetylglucosamine 2-epimerase
MIKIVSVVGNRPQFIKLSPIIREIFRHNASCKPSKKIHHGIIHTGQHFDFNMSEIFFRQLRLNKPVKNLSVCDPDPAQQIGKMISKLAKPLREEKPDWVLVYGDTNSTLAGALTAAKCRLPLGHVEAGLRSFNKQMPEENNRILTDHISNVLFASSAEGVRNLNLERVSGAVLNVGDIMIDTLKGHLKQLDQSIFRILQLQKKKYSLVTVHRDENTISQKRLLEILRALAVISKTETLVFPMHPRTRKTIDRFKLSHFLTGIKVVEPLPYLQGLALQKDARVILTDSGGMQKEAYFLKTPCVTLRDETEWVETIAGKWNMLSGVHQEKIVSCYNQAASQKHAPYVSGIYGNGSTARKIIGRLVKSV